MDKEQVNRQIQLVLLSGIAVTMPFAIPVNHAFIIAAMAHTIISGAFVTSFRGLSASYVTLAAIVFFVLHLVSIMFSDNTNEALAISERRLSLVIFPVILLTSVPKETVRKILLAFVAGNMAALLYCILKAVMAYTETPYQSVFFYHKLSSALGLNAIYFSAYLVFSIHILLDETIKLKGLSKACCIAVAVFFAGGCLMLNSKMMLFVLMTGLAVRFLLPGSRIPVRTKLIGITLAIVLPVLAVLTLPPLKKRVAEEIGTNMQVVTLQTYRYDTPFTGTSLRIVIWRYCYEILSEQGNWFTGVGTGDFQDLLNERYRNTGVYAGGSRPGDTGYIGYGPHNQYIETVFSLGITGLVVFVVFLALLWKSAWNEKNNLLFQLLLLLTFFCFSESVLSTNKGIIFFLFFIFLLYSPAKAQHEVGQNEPAANT